MLKPLVGLNDPYRLNYLNFSGKDLGCIKDVKLKIFILKKFNIFQ